MNKHLKSILVLLLLTVASVIFVVMLPSFQKKMVLRRLNQHFMEVHLDKISVRPMTAEIHRFSIGTKNVIFRVENCKIKWSLWELIFFRQLKIKNVDMDVFISYCKPTDESRISLNEACADLRQKITAALHAAKFMKNSQLPLATTIKHMEIRGMIDIAENAIVELTVQGNDFAPLGTAIIDIKAIFSSQEDVYAETQPLKINFDGEMKIFQSDTGLLSDAELHSTFKVFNNANELGGTFHMNALSKIAKEENIYHLDITSDQSKDAICKADAKYNNMQKKFFIEFAEQFDIRMLSDFFKEISLPKFETKLQFSGAFDFDTWDGEMKSSGELIIASNIVTKLFPGIKLPPQNFDLLIFSEQILTMNDGLLALELFNGKIGNFENYPQILCNSTSSLPIWNNSSGFLFGNTIFNSGKNLAKVEVIGLNPKFVFNNMPFDVDALISGKFTLASRDGVLHLQTSPDSPLIMENCTVAKKNKKYLKNINAQCHANLEFGKNMRIECNEISICDSSGEEICRGSIDFSSSQPNENTLDCYLACELDKLRTMPLLPKNPAIASGVCSGHVVLTTNNDSIKGKSDLKLKSYMLADESVPIDARSEIAFAYINDSIQANIALNATGKHTTSAVMDVAANTNVSSGQMDVKIAMRGDSISIPDVTTILKVPISLYRREMARMASGSDNLTLLLQKNERTSELEKVSPPPVWSKINGEGSMDFGRIFLTNSFWIDKAECCCSLTESQIILKEIRCLIAESPLTVNAKLEHLGDLVNNPYILSVDSNFIIRDMGKIWQLVDPSHESAIDGSGDIFLHLTGEGNELEKILVTAQGNLEAECEHGTLHMARLLPHLYQNMAEIIGMATVIPGNSKGHSVSILLNSLQNLDYDTIKLHANRGHDLHVSIDEFDISGPKVHITGSGEITHTDTKYKQLFNCPIIAGIEIEATGDLGNAMDDLGLITDKPSGTKFMHGPKFIIKGTLGSPDYSDLTKILYKLLQNNISSSGWKIF
ncbi:MAG: hypothetical protein LBI56_02635 [Puniceicoccales bacterium]|jgi:hypothetical protein|nr:hypothetical protein [Puniceicoccales bacterium]